eukprot:scaffold173854_cov49-Prasinocladus_malaysianus.AAC.1
MEHPVSSIVNQAAKKDAKRPMEAGETAQDASAEAGPSTRPEQQQNGPSGERQSKRQRRPSQRYVEVEADLLQKQPAKPAKAEEKAAKKIKLESLSALHVKPKDQEKKGRKTETTPSSIASALGPSAPTLQDPPPPPEKDVPQHEPLLTRHKGPEMRCAQCHRAWHRACLRPDQRSGSAQPGWVCGPACRSLRNNLDALILKGAVSLIGAKGMPPCGQLRWQ